MRTISHLGYARGLSIVIFLVLTVSACGTSTSHSTSTPTAFPTLPPLPTPVPTPYTFQDFDGSYHSVAFSPDQQTLASGVRHTT